MPRYDYECHKCGVMELSHSIHDEAVKRCPECGSKNFQRLLSAGVGFHPPKDMHWENLNDGKGQWISGLGPKNDRNAYCRSLSEAVDKCKKKGHNYEIA